MTGSCGTVLAGLLVIAGPARPDDLATVAEQSGWRATATHDEVQSLLARIEQRSTIVRLLELGRTVENRPIPLVVLANPPVQSVEEVRASDKALVFAFGNIHAGEVCGKEALLMLARELALDAGHDLFADLIIAFAPIYNVDGNERISVDHRPGQVGPADGMGQRPNAQGLDLNRDHVKLESPEARAQARFLSTWNPHLTIDTHTTNGSRHRYVLTYAAPLNPSGHPLPIGFVRDELLPTVTQRLHDRTGYDTFFYGNFNDDHTAWRTYSALPRFGGPYRGLRGQMSVLSEAYAYASYRDRILATREFVREILTYAAEHRRRLIEIDETARRDTIEAGRHPQPDDMVGIRHRVAAFRKPAVIRGYADDDSDEPADLSVVHLGRFEAARSVRRPHAYILAPGRDIVVEKLTQHGIVVKPFAGPATVETYTISRVRRAERAFQGHHLTRLEAEARLQHRSFATGSFVVHTAQPLGTLAVYLLEPESEDGLATWNFFDDIGEGAEFPVHRVRAPEDLPSDAR